VSGRRLADDEVDRLLREALADDLPPPVEGELRRDARLGWRTASAVSRGRWRDGLRLPAAWKPMLPQPALVAAALAMLGAGAVMQAAPPPPAVVESFRGHEALALTAQALARARAMECAVVLDDARGQRVSYRIDWQAPGETRVRFKTAAAERVLRASGVRPSVLTGSAAALHGSPLDPALESVRDYLSPTALAERLAGGWRRVPGEPGAEGAEMFHVGPGTGPPGLTTVIDAATHLPVRLDAAARDGRTQAAVCRWP
jgi:hypothetical protein